MAVSTAFRPMQVWTSTTNRNGGFSPSASSSAGQVVYSVNDGATWVNVGTSTALIGSTVPVALAWRGNISSFGFNNLGLTGPVSELPATLTNGFLALGNNSGLTGAIPVLPNGLTNGGAMFENDTGLRGAFPALPTSLTNADSMFKGCNGVTGAFPALPNSLTSGTIMFGSCTGATGAFPTLPTSLTKADSMFSGCTGATGAFPTLPTSLTKADSMFSGCTGATGALPALPDSLTNGNGMFVNCTGATYTAGTLATTRCVQFTNAFQNCALTSAMVNSMIADFRTAHTNGLINGANLRLGINGGTNGAPTGQGITDRNFLVALGAVITTN
jgi:hypothetical protein